MYLSKKSSFAKKSNAKIGRNHSCPCGSGRKFKHCCIHGPKETRDFSGLIEAFSKFDNLHLVKSLSALSLHPFNHSQNIRIRFALHSSLLSRPTGQEEAISPRQLGDLLRKHLPSLGSVGRLEDPQECLFTDRIPFHGGDYIVYPDILEDELSGLNNILISIFQVRNDIDSFVKHDIYYTTKFILGLSRMMAAKAKHQRYKSSPNRHRREIYIPREGILNRFRKAVSFSMSDLTKKFGRHFDVYEMTKRFAIDQEGCGDLDTDPDTNPIISKPVLLNDNNLIILSPQCLMAALIHWIGKIHSEHHMIPDFSAPMRKSIWHQIHQELIMMDYEPLDNIPSLHDPGPIADGLYKIDDDKIAYVNLLYDDFSVLDSKQIRTQWDLKNIPERHHKRYNELLDFIDINYSEYQVLYINILSGIGRNFSYPSLILEGQLSVSLLISDFFTFCLSKEQERLSLWQYAFSEAYYSKTMKIVSFSFLDKYKFYLDMNSGFYFSDDKCPPILNIEVGYGNVLRKALKPLHDRHLAKLGPKSLIPVRRYYPDPAVPIFGAEGINFPLHFYVSGLSCPVWIKPTMINRELKDLHLYQSMLELISYWFWQISPALKSVNKFLGSDPLNFEIKLDHESQWSRPSNIDLVTDVKSYFRSNLDDRSIRIVIPIEFVGYLFLKDNLKDRILIEILLENIAKITRQDLEIKQIVDRVAPYGPKTFMITDNARKYPLRIKRGLPDARIVSAMHTDLILNELVDKIKMPGNKRIFRKKEDKNKICNQVVGYLFEVLSDKITAFDGRALIERLISINESILWQQEDRAFHTSSRLECFGDSQQIRSNMIDKNISNDKAALSYRCLLEIVGAVPPSGSKKPNHDDIDYLVALVHQIISWGALSDEIHFDLNKEKIELLPSGRIATGTDFNKHIQRPYGISKHDELIQDYIHRFQLVINNKGEGVERSNFDQDTPKRDAFFAEFGLSLDSLLKIVRELIQDRIDDDRPKYVFHSQKIMDRLADLTSLSQLEVKKALNVLTLQNRTSWDSIGNNYKQSDLYPWRYNRKLSILQKPLLQIEKNNQELILYGFRQLLQSVSYLLESIDSGRYRATSAEMKLFIGKSLNKKGKLFNALVARWFRDNLNLSNYLIRENVPIPDLGDIDVLLVDKQAQKLFLIECKKVVPAKTVSEFDSQLKSFDKEDSGWVEKNHRRFAWVKRNLSHLSQQVDFDLQEYKAITFFMISEKIPYPLLRKRFKDVVFLDYKELRDNGMVIIEQAFG